MTFVQTALGLPFSVLKTQLPHLAMYPPQLNLCLQDGARVSGEKLTLLEYSPKHLMVASSGLSFTLGIMGFLLSHPLCPKGAGLAHTTAGQLQQRHWDVELGSQRFLPRDTVARADLLFNTQVREVTQEMSPGAKAAGNRCPT